MVNRIEWTHRGSRFTADVVAEVGQRLQWRQLNEKTDKPERLQEGPIVLSVTEPTTSTGPYVVRIDSSERSIWNNEILIGQGTVSRRA